MKILSGLLAIIAFTITILTSIYFKSPYNFSTQYFSELGTGSYGFIFNIGLVVTAVFLAVFFVKISKISKAGSIFGLISCAFLIGVSVFTGGHTYHVTMTTLFFISVLIASVFISLSIKSVSVKMFELLLILATLMFSYIYFLGNESQILQKLVIFGYFIWIIIITLKHELVIEEVPTYV